MTKDLVLNLVLSFVTCFIIGGCILYFDEKSRENTLRYAAIFIPLAVIAGACILLLLEPALHWVTR